MFHHLRFVSLFLLGSFLAVGCGGPKPDDPTRPLLWAADVEGGEPYIVEDSKAPDKIAGFEKEIADALARQLGRPIQHKQYAYESIVEGLERGDFDFVMNGLEVTPDRQAKLRFTRPYYIYRQQLVARNDEKRFASYDDLKKLKGAQVGTLADTASYRMLKRDGLTERTFTDSVSPYKDLQLGRIDAVLQDAPIAQYLVKKRPEFNAKLQYVGDPIEPGVYAIAFRPKNEELAKQVDAALGKIIQNGELKKILDKWELWNDDQKLLEKGNDPELLKGLK